MNRPVNQSWYIPFHIANMEIPLQENNFYPWPTAGVPLLGLLFWVSIRNKPSYLERGIGFTFNKKDWIESLHFPPKFNNSTSKALHSSTSLISGIRVQSFPVSFCHDRRMRPISPNLCEFIESQKGVTQQGNLVWACFQNSVSPIQDWAEEVKGNIRLLGATVLQYLRSW